MHVFPIQFAADSVGETGNTCDLFLASEYVNKVEWDSLWGPSCVMGQEEWVWPLYLRFVPKIDRKGEVKVYWVMWNQITIMKSIHNHGVVPKCVYNDENNPFLHILPEKLEAKQSMFPHGIHLCPNAAEDRNHGLQVSDNGTSLRVHWQFTDRSDSVVVQWSSVCCAVCCAGSAAIDHTLPVSIRLRLLCSDALLAAANTAHSVTCPQCTIHHDTLYLLHPSSDIKPLQCLSLCGFTASVSSGWLKKNFKGLRGSFGGILTPFDNFDIYKKQTKHLLSFV